MKTTGSYLGSGWPKTCSGCGNPFVVRNGTAQVIVGPDERLYCHGTGCADDAFLAEAVTFRRAA